MLNAILAIIVLGFLVFFHELGHFLVARAFGVGVKVFSLGFGRKVASFQRGKTEYRVAWLPLGGYVAMVGERPGEGVEPPFTEAESFARRPAWQRMGIVAAGPFFNILLTFAILLGLTLTNGRQELAPVVDQVVAESPAATAGFQPGDRILEIDGKAVVFWNDFASDVRGGGERPRQVTVERQGGRQPLTVIPRHKMIKNVFGEDVPTPQIGIMAKSEWLSVPVGPGEAIRLALAGTWQQATMIITGLGKLIQGVVPAKEIGGPIMIVRETYKMAESGLMSLLLLAAFISANLAMMNILPIPVLDGGHLLFYLIEVVTGRPLSEQAQIRAMRAGMALLFALMLFATFNDLRRYVPPMF